VENNGARKPNTTEIENGFFSVISVHSVVTCQAIFLRSAALLSLQLAKFKLSRYNLRH
jgi:hypothetical protein